MRRKGEPVWVLVAIMGGWVGVRAATWDMADNPANREPAVVHVVKAHPQGRHPFRHGLAVRGVPLPHVGKGPPGMGFAIPHAAPIVADRMAPQDGESSLAGVYRLLWLASSTQGDPAHTLLLQKATTPHSAVETGHLPSRDTVALADPRAALLFDRPAGPVRTTARLPRWSADGWLLWREGGDGVPAGAALLPSYGANQAGAVLRYRLDPASPYRPTVYGRAYAALNGTAEREVAAGLSARPLPAVPVMAMAEVRASRFAGGGTHLRPAVALVTELAPVTLPGALRAETYVQAGYVGGRGSTPFIDGQFRLEHIAVREGRTELRLGGGIWGGAQQGAGRLDIGPTATLAFRTARMGARLSLDWRLRVAGNADPGSGPAVTLAAGF